MSYNGAANPCKRKDCRQSHRNTIHTNPQQFGYHEHEPEEEDYSNFSLEAIERGIRDAIENVRRQTGASDEELNAALAVVAGDIMNINMLKEPNERD